MNRIGSLIIMLVLGYPHLMICLFFAIIGSLVGSSEDEASSNSPGNNYNWDFEV